MKAKMCLKQQKGDQLQDIKHRRSLKYLNTFERKIMMLKKTLRQPSKYPALFLKRDAVDAIQHTLLIFALRLLSNVINNKKKKT